MATASCSQRNRSAALTRTTTIKMGHQMNNRSQHRETAIDQGQQERMRGTTRAARSSHALRVYIVVGSQIQSVTTFDQRV